MTLEYISSAKLPTAMGDFDIHAFAAENSQEHVALTYGDISGDKDNAPRPLLARVHSECLTGDSLFSLRCDCGLQLHNALRALAAEGAGILVYLRQEGRGIGLTNKIRAYALQDQGLDTVDANQQLGFKPDLRDYAAALDIFDHFNIKSVRLMTNNPRKIDALNAGGVQVVERLDLKVDANPHNAYYLETKSTKLGHLL